MNININDIYQGNQSDTSQELRTICAQHPECKDCPMVGELYRKDNIIAVCENGINKKKEEA